MNKILLQIFVLYFGIVHSARVKRLGNSEVCTINQHPYVVLIFGYDQAENRTEFYDGVLITLEWVLTSRYVLVFVQAYNTILVSAGKDQIGLEEIVKKDNVTTINKTVAFPTTKLLYDNLVLMKLSNKLSESDRIKPVKLPKSLSFWGKCDKSMAVGRGSSVPSGGKVHYHRLLLLQCDKELEIDDTLLCISDHNPETLIKLSMCSRDAGLPVVCEQTLIGIIDVVPEPYTCDGISFVINIAHYMTWIGDVTGAAVAFRSSPSHKRQADNFDYEEKGDYTAFPSTDSDNLGDDDDDSTAYTYTRFTISKPDDTFDEWVLSKACASEGVSVWTLLLVSCTIIFVH